MGFTEILSSLVVGTVRPATAAPGSDLSSYDAMGLAELIRTKQIAPGDAVEDTIRIRLMTVPDSEQRRPSATGGSRACPSWSRIMPPSPAFG
jgi:hypothetical protein